MLLSCTPISAIGWFNRLTYRIQTYQWAEELGCKIKSKLRIKSQWSNSGLKQPLISQCRSCMQLSRIRNAGGGKERNLWHEDKCLNYWFRPWRRSSDLTSVLVGEARRKRAPSFSGAKPQHFQQLQYSFKRATKLLLHSSIPLLINIFGNTAIQLYGHSISIDGWLEVIFTAGLPIQCPGRMQYP